MGSGAATRYCTRCLTTFGGDPGACPNLGCQGPRPPEGWGTVLAPGALFDRHYRVNRQLAVGGGGMTYLATEVDANGEDTGPLLAIKVLFAGREQGSFLQRLATEAQILRELNHPNIVECRGFVHRAGHAPYLVTRFESGGNLLDHVRRSGVLPLAVVARIGRQVCWALGLAHSRGIVHRDMKPENLLLTEAVPASTAPAVRVADFGIAKVVDSNLGARTRVGAFVGTPAYAAPEQLQGAAPAPSTDVYGLGAVLYFCATGQQLLQYDPAESWEDRHAALLARLPPRVQPGLGQDPAMVSRFNAVLAAAMTPDAQTRCTVEQLDHLLAAFLAGKSPGSDTGAETGPQPVLDTFSLDLRESADEIAAVQAELQAPPPEVVPAAVAHAAWVPPNHPSRSGAVPSASPTSDGPAPTLAPEPTVAPPPPPPTGRRASAPVATAPLPPPPPPPAPPPMAPAPRTPPPMAPPVAGVAGGGSNTLAWVVMGVSVLLIGLCLAVALAWWLLSGRG